MLTDDFFKSFKNKIDPKSATVKEILQKNFG